MQYEDRDVEAVRRFNRFYTREIGVLQEKLLHSAFSLAEGRVLYEIAYDGSTGTRRPAGPTAADIAKALDLDGGYLSRILQRFVRRRLVTRTISTADGRQAHLGLTARGRSALVPLERLAREHVADMLRPLSPPARRRIVDAMELIQQSIRERHARVDEGGLGPVTVRAHRAGDMGWIVSRQSALYAEEYGWTTEYEALASEIVAQFLKTFDSTRERCWIAERNAAPAGAVMVVKHSDTVAKLRLLHVERWARGAGIGRRLIDECVRFSQRVGYEKITLWTQANLLAARHLYRAAGFTCVAAEPHHRFGKDLIAETWELVL